MQQTKGLGFFSVASWILLIQLAASTRPNWIDTLPTFYDAHILVKVVVHNVTGDVFVGGRNILYHFSADLDLKQNVSTGPLEDYPGCLIPPYPCSKARVAMDNVATLLEIVYHFEGTPSLLLCGSVYNNLCQVRPIADLEEYHWVHPYNESLGFATNPRLNYALFETGYQGRWSLFIAAHDEAQYRSEKSAPYLSSKMLMKEGDRYHFQYPYQTDTRSSAVTIKGSSTRHIMDGGFVYRGFIYFPIYYVFGSTVHESRLGRFCTKDPNFQTYAELPIQCNYRGKTIKRQTAAHLGVSRTTTDEALYVSFNDDPSGTALCVFEMPSIVEAFTTRPRYCNRDIVGETCDRERSEEIMDFCGSFASPYIVSQPLEVAHAIFIPSTPVTAVTVAKLHDELIIIAGATLGFIIEVSLTTGKLISVTDILDSKTRGPFVSPFVFNQQRTHIYLLITNKIVKYPVASCGALETCEECFTRGKLRSTRCGWCSGRCAHPEECTEPGSFSVDICTPSINEVFPLKGPIQGGNAITITGYSFGSYADDAHNSISVAGIPCKVLFWNNTQVNCTMGPTSEEISGPIQLNVINYFNSTLGYTIAGSTIGQSNFSYYVGAKLYGIRPGKGPTSGGTIVTLFGYDLDFDKNKTRSIIVGGRLCSLILLDNYTASCVTQNTSSTKFPNETTAIHIDGVAYVMDKHPPSTFNLTGLSQSFKYTPDPYIQHIRPGITTMSGLMNLTAMGRQLDSVKSPKLVVKIAEDQIIGSSEYVEPCWTDPKSNGTQMNCRTPSLKNAMIFPIPTRTHPLVTQVSFIMDGVQQLREFAQHRIDLSRLLYYPDPEFSDFQETEKIMMDQKQLEIKGTSLDLVHLADYMQVRIGQKETCKIASVSSDFLLCDLPPSIFANSSVSGSNISVEIIVGSTIHHLSYLQLEQPNKGNIVLGIFLLIAIIAILLVLIYWGYRWCKDRRRKHLHGINSAPLANEYSAVPTRAAPTSSCSISCSEFPVSRAKAESPSIEMPLVDSDTLFLLADNDLIISKEFLTIGGRLGKGQFGYVFEGFLKRSNETEPTRVAVKTLQDDTWQNHETIQIFMGEALLMKDFNHPNVLSLLGVCFVGNGPSIVLPFMENKDLHTYIIDEDRELFVAELLKFSIDVTAGMSYLEDAKFIHRDLATRNCLLDSSLNAKVSDFGLSRDIYVDNYYCQERKGKIPYKWTAPESFEKKLFSTKSDVWSYGVLLWELMTRGSLPYCNVDNFDLPTFLNEGRRLDRPEYCPLPLYDVMLACWNYDRSLRPSFHELYNYTCQIRKLLLHNRQEEAMPAAEGVPAQHTKYHDSQEHYLSMEGRALNEDILNGF